MLWNAQNGNVPVGATNMRYVSFGHGDKALLLIPGLSDGLATVEGKALLLARSYQVFFDDYTVYLFSRKHDLLDGTSIRTMAADQAEALRNIGIDRVSVLGVSQGGMIAQWLAIDYPELVEKLVIAVSAPYANGIIRQHITYWIELARRGDHKNLMIDTAENSYSEARLKGYRLLYPTLGHVGRPQSYDRFIANAHAILEFDARERLGDITCPTLILGGSDDRIVGVQASRELHEAIPGSKLQIFEGLGHAAYEEAPDFNERVLAFLKES